MYTEYLKKYLSDERYNHCVRTKEMAQKLCDKYNIDNIAVTAAYLHDIAKELSLDEMVKLLTKEDIKDACGMMNKNILHGLAGARLCEKLGIKDERIISCIKYHTFGKKNMSDIEKVVYISDAIELGRNYEGVEEIRDRVFKSLNEGIIYEIEHKVKYLLSDRKQIHPYTIEFYNKLLEENK